MGHRPRPRQLSNLSSTDVAWVAGLVEGEGSIFVTDPKRYPKPRRQMSLTDHDVLLRLQRVLGCGSIVFIERMRNRPNRKPCWQFALCTQNDLDVLLRQIYPFMGQRRRRQIDDVLAFLDGKPRVVQPARLQRTPWVLCGDPSDAESTPWRFADTRTDADAGRVVSEHRLWLDK